MFYVVHVVKRYAPGFMMGDREGEWMLEEFEDVTLADLRCYQLNEGLSLRKHHWYEVREKVDGLQESSLYPS